MPKCDCRGHAASGPARAETVRTVGSGIVRDALAPPGRAPDERTLAFYGARFGQDFAHVPKHSTQAYRAGHCWIEDAPLHARTTVSRWQDARPPTEKSGVPMDLSRVAVFPREVPGTSWGSASPSRTLQRKLAIGQATDGPAGIRVWHLMSRSRAPLCLSSSSRHCPQSFLSDHPCAEALVVGAP
jgi:hypothetical protein